MSWFLKFPWLVFGLLLITYSTFGWQIAASDDAWSQVLVEFVREWDWFLEEAIVAKVIDLLSALAIFFLAVVLTTPVVFMRLLFGSWLKSDNKAIISFLAWSFAGVFFLRWLEYFAGFLLLLGTAILGRLELQAAGYNRWQVFTILTSLCLSGFGAGLLGYFYMTQGSRQ